MWRHVVLVLFSLAGLGLANRELIEAFCTIDEVPDGVSGSLTYHYPESLDSPGTVNCTVLAESRCTQVLDSNLLQGRSWYITQDKAYFGRGYNPEFFQVYNLECPIGHYLNLAFQGSVSLVCDLGVDTVRVNTSRGDTGPICTVDEVANSYISRGEPAGVILEDGKARIEFCSNRMGVANGFYIRGTCINPILYYNQPGCVDYNFFLAWDPEFVTRVDKIFTATQTTEVPHKRSAEEYSDSFENLRKKVKEFKAVADRNRETIENAKRMEEGEREKRGVRYYFDFPEGTEITYINYVLTFRFPNGTERSFTVYWLSAYNDLYGTRIYDRNATRQIGDTTGATTITFTGPGRVDIFPNSERTSINAYLIWEPPRPFDEFLENEGAEEQEIVARIYDYIVKYWASPYVVIDEFMAENLDPKPYPFSGGPGSIFFPRVVRRADQVGIIFPEIQEGSVCKRAVRFDEAPLRSSPIDRDLLYFCSFFQYACEPVLATACREIMFLDPFDVDPLARQRMMGMMGGGD